MSMLIHKKYILCLDDLWYRSCGRRSSVRELFGLTWRGEAVFGDWIDYALKIRNQRFPYYIFYFSFQEDGIYYLSNHKTQNFDHLGQFKKLRVKNEYS